MKYRKKVFELEAFQLMDLNSEITQQMPPAWFILALTSGVATIEDKDEGSCIIKTAHGQLGACPGDWIIKGIDGEIYPCSDERFKQLYEPVGE